MTKSQKQFSIWRIKFLHPEMWNDHNITIPYSFIEWWFVYWTFSFIEHLNIFVYWTLIRQVTAPCNVACGSGILTVNSPCNVIRGSGMRCHWIRPNVRHIWILHLVSISTTSPQSTCHSAPVSKILSKSDHPRQKKMTSCRFLLF